MSKELKKNGYVTAPGGRMWCEMVNTSHPGVPLLIIHGGPGLGHKYLESLSRLSTERPVIFYDQLGCGRSDKPVDPALWTVERFAEEVESVRNAMGLDRVHILGHSNGSLIAARYMSSRSASGVASIVLSNPVLSASRLVNDGRKLLAQMPSDVQATIREAVANESFATAEYDRAWDEFAKLHQCRVDPMPTVLRNNFDEANFDIFGLTWGVGIPFAVIGSFKSVEAVDWIRRIEVPVLFITGRHDYASPESVEFYHQNTPNSEVEIVEDASHFPHLERPNQYLKVVGDFLRRIESLSTVESEYQHRRSQKRP
jgi:proline iminopeptidase